MASAVHKTDSKNVYETRGDSPILLYAISGGTALIKGINLQVLITGDEARLLGTPADFNTVSRAIRKCKVGKSIHLPLRGSQSKSNSLEIRCTNDSFAIRHREGALFIAYPEKLRGRLSPCFAMPAETFSGSIFFINASEIEFLHELAEGSLKMALQVGDPDQC